MTAQSPPRVTGPSSVGRWLAFFALAGAVVALDQATKVWVDTAYPVASPDAPAGLPQGPTQVLGDLVRIANVHNDGGIFGLFGSSAALLGVASTFVIGGIVWYQARHGLRGGPLLTIGLGLLLGGAIGNLIDRLRIGSVIDWLDMGIGDARWYTFNVADAAISVSLVILLAVGLLGDHPVEALRSRLRAGRPGPSTEGPRG